MADNKTKARKRLVLPVRTGESKVGIADLVNKAKEDPKGFEAKARELTDAGDLRFEKVNIRDLHRAFKDVPINVHVTDEDGKERALMASTFPLLAGLMMVAEINDTIAEVPGIADQLVTDFEDKKKITVIDRLLTLDTNVDRVDEGKDFPPIGASEESYEIRSKRNGRRLDITAEMIEENDTPNIVERVNKLVNIANTFAEEETIQAIHDVLADGTTARNGLLQRGSAAAALYSSTANTPGTRVPSGNLVTSNALASVAALNTARERLATFRDERGKRGVVSLANCILLVPDALWATASEILNSTLIPGKANAFNVWGPSGPFRPALLSSPKLDDISGSTWFLGDFKAQFRRKWKLRFESATMGMDAQRFLDARIAYQARLAWDFGTNPIDYNRVVKCTA